MLDFVCRCGRRTEHFFHPSQADAVTEAPCDCGQMASRTDEIVHAPAVVWTGTIGQRYRDKDKEGYYAKDGMDVYTRKTPDGKPKLLHLESWNDVSRHCKEEGLVDPREMGRNMTVSEDGKQLGYDKGATGTEV
jgi:hypothetical protein